jgi:hypothetical protein
VTLLFLHANEAIIRRLYIVADLSILNSAARIAGRKITTAAAGSALIAQYSLFQMGFWLFP